MTVYYSVISSGDGWDVIDNVTGDLIKWHPTEQDALKLMEELNTKPYFKFNDERDALLYWN